MARVLVPLADGFEEIEAVTVIDLLRRGGVEVVTAALKRDKAVTGSHDLSIVPDTDLDAALAQDFDMVVLPGGMPGADHLENDARLNELLKRMANSGKFVAAICAAPKVLAGAGLLAGKTATSYPGFLADTLGGIDVRDEPVVRDGNITTSRGPGTAMDFALDLLEQLRGADARHEVESRLQRPS